MDLIAKIILKQGFLCKIHCLILYNYTQTNQKTVYEDFYAR